MDENSFFSIDRLVEFGIGMSVAQQMVNSMNKTMQQMYVPGVQNPVTQPSSPLIYLAIEGSQAGPFSEAEVSQLIQDHKITKDSLAWMPGMREWQSIDKIPAIMRIVALTPPPVPTM